MFPRKKARPNPEEMTIKDDAQTLVSTSTIQTQTPTSQSQASQASPATETDQNTNSEVPSEQQIMGGSDAIARRSTKDVGLLALIQLDSNLTHTGPKAEELVRLLATSS